MSNLTEMDVADKHEVLENGCVQVRIAKRILNQSGEIVAQNYHRFVISPLDTPDAGASDRTKAICSAVHTPECKAKYQASLENT